MAQAIHWMKYDQLKAQRLAEWEIARQWGIPWGISHREKSKREGGPSPRRHPNHIGPPKQRRPSCHRGP